MLAQLDSAAVPGARGPGRGRSPRPRPTSSRPRPSSARPTRAGPDKKLRARGAAVVAAQEYDDGLANYESAKAALAVCRERAAVAKADLEEATVNLGYTTIRSPVKGVILDRRINIGQTVVASLNAPSLFLIAKDLSRLEIWSSVNETDIGSIHEGQMVQFTVGAFRDETFEGKVSKIRLNASMSQNVVTYTVVIAVDNSDGRLLPYLTARIQFEVEARRGVLLVPNAALRWQPRPQRHRPRGEGIVCPGPAIRGPTGRATGSDAKADQLGALDPAGRSRPAVAVRVGLSDGSSPRSPGRADQGQRSSSAQTGRLRSRRAVDPPPS